MTKQDKEYYSIQTLYHATGISNKQDILRYGLKFQKNHTYEDSRDDRIYLANDYDVALSYAEVSERFDGEKIVVFAVDVDDLDLLALHVDDNVLLDENELPATFEYAKEIPAKCITLVNDERELDLDIDF